MTEQVCTPELYLNKVSSDTDATFFSLIFQMALFFKQFMINVMTLISIGKFSIYNPSHTFTVQATAHPVLFQTVAHYHDPYQHRRYICRGS